MTSERIETDALGEPFGLPPVDELRESVMQLIDELRAYLQMTAETIGGNHGTVAGTVGSRLGVIYASLETEADKSKGWKVLERQDALAVNGGDS